MIMPPRKPIQFGLMVLTGAGLSLAFFWLALQWIPDLGQIVFRYAYSALRLLPRGTCGALVAAALVVALISLIRHLRGNERPFPLRAWRLFCITALVGVLGFVPKLLFDGKARWITMSRVIHRQGGLYDGSAVVDGRRMGCNP